MGDETGWDLMSGNAIEEGPKKPAIEMKFKNCGLELSGSLAKAFRNLGLEQVHFTQTADGGLLYIFTPKD